MKIYLLIAFLLGLTIFSYYHYCYRLNRKLIIKKMSLQEDSQKNPYSKQMKISTSGVFIFLILLIISIFYVKDSIIERVKKEANFNDVFVLNNTNNTLKGTFIQTEKTDSFAIETLNNIYLLNNNEITSIGINENDIKTYKYNDDYSTVNYTYFQKNIVVARNNQAANTSEILIHDINSLIIKEKAVINGNILDVFTREDKIHMFVENKNINENRSKNITSISFFNSGLEKTTEYKNMYYIPKTNVYAYVSHIVIDVNTYDTIIKTFYVSEYFLKIEGDYAYFGCNIINNKNSLEKSALFKYNLDDLYFEESKRLCGRIISEIYTNNGKIIINNQIKDQNINYITTLVFNEDLDIIKTYDLDISNNENIEIEESIKYITIIDNNFINNTRIISYDNKEIMDRTNETEFLGYKEVFNDYLLFFEKINNNLVTKNYHCEKDKYVYIGDINYTITGKLDYIKPERFVVCNDIAKLVFKTSSTIEILKMKKSTTLSLDKTLVFDKNKVDDVFLTNNYIILLKDNHIQVLNNNFDNYRNYSLS